MDGRNTPDEGTNPLPEIPSRYTEVTRSAGVHVDTLAALQIERLWRVGRIQRLAVEPKPETRAGDVAVLGSVCCGV